MLFRQSMLRINNTANTALRMVLDLVRMLVTRLPVQRLDLIFTPVFLILDLYQLIMLINLNHVIGIAQ